MSVSAQMVDPGARQPVPSDPDRVRALVEAGVLPRAALLDTERAEADALDEAILRRTLYGDLGVEDLTEKQAEDMVGAAQRIFDRKTENAKRLEKLANEGAVPRRSLDAAQNDVQRAQLTLDLALDRAKVIRELAEIVLAEQMALAAAESNPPSGPTYERYVGNGVFRSAHLKTITLEFERRFAAKLPISAHGDTALHRSLGFNHSGRVDIALDPDQEEGRWLRRFLEGLKIPYYAFRSSVRGKSTGPHIHIGPPSEPLHLGG